MVTREEIHAEWSLRPDLAHHPIGCNLDECVLACEAGRCTCAGCDLHLDDAVRCGEALQETRSKPDPDDELDALWEAREHRYESRDELLKNEDRAEWERP